MSHREPQLLEKRPRMAHSMEDTPFPPSETQSEERLEPSAPGETTLSIMADPRATVERLLRVEEEARLRSVMRALTPEQAATLVRAAAAPRDKARLLASMERLQRAETLDFVTPTLFATLVENPETGADYLLGEVSLERFRELLALCSPDQRFWWVSRAAAHEDGAAQLLTLLLPPKDLAEMLLTVPEFRRNFVQLRQYEPDQFEQVPCKNKQLNAVLQFMADFDTEMYKAVFRAARNQLDWEHVNQDATTDFIEPEPIPDFEKYEAPDSDLIAADGSAAPTVPSEAATELTPEEEERRLNALAHADVTSLATATLSPERLLEIQEELEAMIHREVVDAGGSFSPEALEQASGRMHCYLHFGLARLGNGIPTVMSRLLAERSLLSLVRAGMEYIEAIRQRALRIAHLRERFDKEQSLLLEGLLHPRVGTTPGTRAEYIFWLPSPARKPEERRALLIVEARDAMEEMVGWATLSQRMPEAGVRRALASTAAGAQAYMGALVVATLLYRRWDPAMVDLQDVHDFHDRMVDTVNNDLSPAAREALDAAAERWAKAQSLTEEESRRVGLALLGAAERLSAWLVRYPRPKARQLRQWVYLGPQALNE